MEMEVKDTGKKLFKVAARETNSTNDPESLRILAVDIAAALEGAYAIMNERYSGYSVEITSARMLSLDEEPIYEVDV